MKTSCFLPCLLALTNAFAQLPPPVPAAPGAPPVAVPVPPPAPADEEIIIEQRLSGPAPKRVRSVQAGVEALAAPGGGMAIREYSSSGKPSRCLVVQSGSMDADALARAEEDLAIMGRILDNTVKGKRDEVRLYSGIPVDVSVFGSSSGARNIYVEGYGAMFLLTVKFPLLAPPEKPQEPKAKDTTSDEWKRAREEISGAADVTRAYGDIALSFDGPPEEFDETKVDDLKTALLEALKNATHMRMLKPSEWVTIVVQGSDAGGATVTKSTRDGKTNMRVTATRAGGGGARRSESVMTLRVKKSDADAFASGKLDFDAFRKKVDTQTYLRRPMAWSIPDAFNLPVVR